MPKMPNVGTPRTTPRCIKPESFETRAAHARTSAAVSRRSNFPVKIPGVIRPLKHTFEIGVFGAQILFRSDDHDVRKPASQLIKAMPLFPGPLVLAARMNGDGSGWQIKLPARRHGERLRKLALPAEVARDSLDTVGIAFGQPAPSIEEMHAPRLHAVLERGAPGRERGNIVDLVGKAPRPESVPRPDGDLAGGTGAESPALPPAVQSRPDNLWPGAHQFRSRADGQPGSAALRAEYRRSRAPRILVRAAWVWML